MTQYGIQMFSLRDVTKEDLEAGLRAAKEAGYAFVEFAGFFGHDAETVKGWLDKYGLKASGTHTGCDELQPDKLEATIAYHKAICFSSQRSGSRAPLLTDTGQLIAGQNSTLLVNDTYRPIGTLLHLENNTLENAA